MDPITQQPTSTNLGGLVPAIERAILRLGTNQENPAATNSSNDDNPPSYTSLFPESQSTADANISRTFQTNNYKELRIKDLQIFKDLSEEDHKLLDDAVNAPDTTIYSAKIALEVAEDQKCTNFQNFMTIFVFVKRYLELKNEQNAKSTLPTTEIHQTRRYENSVLNQVETIPPQSRYPDPVPDPFCCWICWQTPPLHSNGCPCCFCCCDGDNSSNVQPDDGCCDCDCGDCEGCGECCGECCGSCDCTDCF